MPPSDTSDSSDSSGLVTRIFLEALDQGRDIDLEGLCKKHPDHAGEIRARYELYRIAFSASPDVAAGDTSSDEEGIWNKFLERLLSRGPAFLRYHEQGELGKGGMGVVSEVYDEDLRRLVARKTLKRSVVSEFRVGRFVEEAQVMAQLEHPGIPPIYEMGMREDGRLYFTMKRVEGHHLGEVLEQRKRGEGEWSLVRLLGILQRVCEAVAFAHAKGVIHRDLKPSNIMVGHFGETYVMDWGVARILGGVEDTQTPEADASDDRRPVTSDRKTGSPSDSSMMTVEGDAIGTPFYMSPEQAAGRLNEIGPASDVYALGCILYEILSGESPYQKESSSSAEVINYILEGPPAPVRTLSPDVPVELEAICEMAMAREISERYPSTREFADDLRSYQENRVVRAYAAGPLVELRKWLGRNRSLAASIGASILLLVLGAWGIAWKEIEARKEVQAEQEKTELARDELFQLVGLQSDMLNELDPQAMGASLFKETMKRFRSDVAKAGVEGEQLVREVEAFRANLLRTNPTSLSVHLLDDQVLAPFALRLDQDLVESRTSEASLRETISRIYRALGLDELSVEQQKKVVALRLEEHGEQHPGTLEAIGDLGMSMQYLGSLDESETLLRQAIAGHQSLLGDADPDTLYWVGRLGGLLAAKGDYVEGERLIRKALEGRLTVLGTEDWEVQEMTLELGQVLHDQGRYQEATDLLRDAADGFQQLSGPESSDALRALSVLAQHLLIEGRGWEAEKLLREVLEGMRRLLGDDHPNTIHAQFTLGDALTGQGKLKEGESLLRDANQKHRRLFGDERGNAVARISILAHNLRSQERYEESESLLKEAYETSQRFLGEEHPSTLNALTNLSHLYKEQGDPEKAEDVLLKVLIAQQRILPEGHENTLSTIEALALVLLDQDRYLESEELMLEVYSAFQENRGDLHSSTLIARHNLAVLFECQERYDEAESHFRGVLEGQRSVQGEGHPNTLNTTCNLGWLLFTQGQTNEAEKLVRSALEMVGEDEPLAENLSILLSEILDYRRAQRVRQDY